MYNSTFLRGSIQSITHLTDELLFPQFCNNCEIKLNFEEIVICKKCMNDIEIITSINRVQDLKSSKSLDFAYSGFWFDENLQISLHVLKYQGFTNIVEYLLYPILPQILKLMAFKSIDFIVPVPLHTVKYRERGFNQAEVICEYISQQSNVPILNAMSRNLWTKSQTKLSINERKSNIHNAFSVVKSITNSNYLIIDDVLTTGSTANECAKVIKENSFSTVGVFTIGAAE